MDEMRAYDELQAYTLTLGDRAFVHQHVVDAWAAQHADERTKPITIVFALLGLHLHLERGFSGREVQRVHVLLARWRPRLPAVPLPDDRGRLTATDVMVAPPGPPRHSAIDDWCASVWDAYRDSHPVVEAFLEENGIG